MRALQSALCLIGLGLCSLTNSIYAQQVHQKNSSSDTTTAQQIPIPEAFPTQIPQEHFTAYPLIWGMQEQFEEREQRKIRSTGLLLESRVSTSIQAVQDESTIHTKTNWLNRPTATTTAHVQSNMVAFATSVDVTYILGRAIEKTAQGWHKQIVYGPFLSLHVEASSSMYAQESLLQMPVGFLGRANAGALGLSYIAYKTPLSTGNISQTQGTSQKIELTYTPFIQAQAIQLRLSCLWPGESSYTTTRLYPSESGRIYPYDNVETTLRRLHGAQMSAGISLDPLLLLNDILEDSSKDISRK